MFKRNFIALAVIAGLTGGIAGCTDEEQSTAVEIPVTPIVDLSVLNYVNPMIGTAASGHTFPGATHPAGMVQLSPDTFIGSNSGHESGQNPWHSASGYWDSSNYLTGDIVANDVPLYGFSHTHLSGTGATDLGDILVLPYSDMADTQLNSFDKANEKASAGFYKTRLNKGGIEVELTATKRVGLHKYTFAKGAERSVKFDLGHTLLNNNGQSLNNKIEVLDEYTIRGRRTSTGWFQGQNHLGQDIFFYAKFNQPVARAMLGEQDKMPTREMRYNSVYQGDDVTAYLDFGQGDQAIEIWVGISPVNWQGAQQNLEAEAPTFDFAKAKSQAEYAWAEKLTKIRAEGGKLDGKNQLLHRPLSHDDCPHRVLRCGWPIR